MRVLILAMVFFMFELFAMAEKAYVILPLSVAQSDVYAVGVTKNGEEASIYIKEGKPYYGGKANIFEMETSKEAKVVLGYKVSSIEKYVILASEDVDVEAAKEPHKTIKKNYDDEIKKEKPDLRKIIRLSDYEKSGGGYDYDLFPGHVVEESSVFSALRIGEEISPKESPSNVVLKFFTEVVTPGEYTVSGEVNINPNNAGKKNNGIRIETKDEVIYYFKSKDKDGIGDINIENYYKTNATNNPNGPGKKVEIDNVAYLRFRLKGGSGSLKLNDKDVSLGEEDKKFEFKGDLKVIIRNKGSNKNKPSNGHWYIEITGDAEAIEPLPDEAPDTGTKVEDDEVYIIKGEGLSYEADVEMTSGKEEKRKRISDVNIDVLNNSFEIKSIKE